MNRNKAINDLYNNQTYDIIIIGGGATGLGAAVDAATRGYKTLLLEKYDFAKGTSSKATKLVHGGVRYLAQGNIKLVRDALRERGYLLKNAAHVCNTMLFVIPCYRWWQKVFYGVGLKIYDILSGKLSLGSTKIISSKKVLEFLPQVNSNKLKGGIVYTDGQFDDARLAINLAQTATKHGATVINYCSVTNLIKENNLVCGVVCQDELTGISYTLKAKAVINATGVFVDEIMKMDNGDDENLVTPSQGIHIVVDKKYFTSNQALMIPKTTDGRVLFAVPWQNHVIIGTTDTEVKHIEIEPKPINAEVDFILQNVNQYLNSTIQRADVKSVFVGLRPLVKDKNAKKTSLLARDHSIIISPSKLISITGGKWTTYRKMAEQVVNNAAYAGNLSKAKCVTQHLSIHGNCNTKQNNDFSFYGTDEQVLNELYKENISWQEKIHPNFSYTKAMVVLAVRNEMACKVEDVLARRLRLLFLDAQVAIDVAPTVATIMAKELNENQNWIDKEIKEFNVLAKQYLLS
ncbi:MAG: glycerol-3-phosphate dehydrogenase/oxidase [Ferruginibacter sp.]|nr:glycerol-3-phosphate dehydrogenase/oxidase [Ferruginibacter sp.]